MAFGDDGASGAPTDAPHDDFCQAFLSEPDGFGSENRGQAADAAHEYAGRLLEVGTPEDISDDARRGFEIYVDYLSNVTAIDVHELKDSEPSEIFDEDELAKFDALSDVTAACAPVNAGASRPVR